MDKCDVFWFDENGRFGLQRSIHLKWQVHIEALEKSEKQLQARLDRYQVIDRRTGKTSYQSSAKARFRLLKQPHAERKYQAMEAVEQPQT
jgi:hypothetical protein